MKLRVTTAMLALLACIGVAASQQPGEQFKFAEELRRDGDEVLALLEYRRFAHLYPDNDRAPRALMQAARIRLLHTGEIGKAERTLGRITKRYPESKTADQAGQLKDFVAANSDYGGKPLARYLRARKAAEKGQHSKALELFESIPEKWKDARLADDAMLSAAKLHLQETDEPGKARKKLDALLESYPDRSTAPEAMYRRAETVAKIQEGDQPAIRAYRKVTEEFPDSTYGKRARRRIKELEEKRSFVKRTSDEELVRDYEVVGGGGYENGKRYVEKIELSSSPSPAQVRATMEDALINAIKKRRDEKDSVTVEAYYTYPMSEAGEATWRPGEDPKYDVEERETEDRVKDTLFDILRGR